MIRKNLSSTLLIITAAAALMLAGCKDNNAAGSSSAAAPSNAAAQDKQPSREIVIEANDQMQFDKKEFVVAPGETVKLTLLNKGTMPKFSMGHNVVILKRGTNADSFAEAAASAATNDYIPADQANRVVAHTKMLGGGESDSVIFTAPSVRAEYVFLCTFPGHVQAGMRGVMRVQ